MRIGQARSAQKPASTPWWRWLITLFLACGVVVSLSFFFSEDQQQFVTRLAEQQANRPERAHVPTVVTDLTESQQAQLNAMRETVAELARRHVGSVPKSDEFALQIIQEILDSANLNGRDTYQLRSLGVAVGDVLSAQRGMDWVAVQDQYGQALALRYKSNEHLFFPLTWISKRVEANLPFEATEFYAYLMDIADDIDGDTSLTR